MATSSTTDPLVWDPSEKLVPVEIVQRMFYDTGMSMNAAAIALGWTRVQTNTHRWKRDDGTWGEGTYPKDSGDSTRLARTLGLAYQLDKNDVPQWRHHVQYDTAVTLCRAWGLDPVDYGI